MSGDHDALVGGGYFLDETGQVLAHLSEGNVPRHVHKYVQIMGLGQAPRGSHVSETTMFGCFGSLGA
jgi:hypothetical protein